MKTVGAAALIYRTVAEGYYGKAVQEWSDMYDNGSIHNWPDIEDDQEEDFWLYVGDYSSMMIEDLLSKIKSAYGFDWEIYSYGRGNATYAPDIKNMHHGFNRTLNSDDMYHDHVEFEDDDWEGDEQDSDYWRGVATCFKEHYEAFKLINERVKDEAGCIGASYEEHLKYREEEEREEAFV